MYDIGCMSMITRLTQPPPPPPMEFRTWFGTPWKDCVCQKNAVTLHYYEKEDRFLFMLTQRVIISILPCKDLS